MARQEFDENVRKIKDWLTDEGTLRDKVADDNASYHVHVESPPNSGRLIDVVIPKHREDLVIIASATTFVSADPNLTPHADPILTPYIN